MNRSKLIRNIVAVVGPCLILSTFAAAQSTPPGEGSDAQKCVALAQLNLENAPGGPALITSARLSDVPPSGLEQWFAIPSGYGSTSSQVATRIHQYCEVAGYVAPQNKFELKLPLPRDFLAIGIKISSLMLVAAFAGTWMAESVISPSREDMHQRRETVDTIAR